MSQVLSVALLVLCLGLLGTHFFDIKNSHKTND
jgi:hypothetical protein